MQEKLLQCVGVLTSYFCLHFILIFFENNALKSCSRALVFFKNLLFVVLLLAFVAHQNSQI